MRIDDKQMKMVKGELRLHPSYNELIKEISKETYKNKNIRDVIDRNAYDFRDSPLGSIYDNNTVDMRQQQFKQLIEKMHRKPQIFDLTAGDTMDDLRDGAIQTLDTTMDKAEEQHGQQINQVAEQLTQQHLDDLHQRAKQAKDWDDDMMSARSSSKSSSTSSYEDMPPLEELHDDRKTASDVAKKFVKGITEKKSRARGSKD